jgi:hypothetical protein
MGDPEVVIVDLSPPYATLLARIARRQGSDRAPRANGLIASALRAH